MDHRKSSCGSNLPGGGHFPEGKPEPRRSRPPREDQVGVTESAGFYRQLIQDSNDAIYLLYNRRFILINDRFRELFGVTLEDANEPDFDFLELVAPSSRKAIEDRARQVESGELPATRYEFTARSRSGREFEVESSVTYVPHENGVATLGSLRDISHRWVFEQQLLRAGKIEFVERLASEVAHDLNDVFTVLVGQAELIAAELPDGHPLKKKAREIAANAYKATRLTHRIRALSRPSSSSPASIDLSKEVAETEQLLRRLLGDRISLLVDLTPHSAHIQAESGLVEHLLMVLAVAAREHLAADSVLGLEVCSELSAADDGGESAELFRSTLLSISVSEPLSGDGDVSSEALASIFPNVEEAAAVLDARASMISDSASGSAIRIDFPTPADARADRALSTPAGSHSEASGETILIVDDDDGVRALAAEVLEQEGYRILTAVDGAHAIHVAETEAEIHLLVTDVVMPVLGGAGLHDALRPNHQDMRVLYVSGYRESELVNSGKIGRDGALLAKPFTPDGLIESVRSALAVA